MTERPELLWDVLADELHDAIEAERRRHAAAAQPCKVCGAPTTAVSGVCGRHDLDEVRHEAVAS